MMPSMLPPYCDDEPDKIRKEISQRDSFGISVFCFFINGFNDGQQDFQFFQRC
jgi:hypothetical protein